MQCLYYQGKRSAIVCTGILLAYLAVFAGWEVGMTYAIRVRCLVCLRRNRFIRRPLPARVAVGQLFTYAHVIDSHVHNQGMMVHGRNYHHILDFCGIASGVLICVGIMCVSPYSSISNRSPIFYSPQFIEIYKRKQVTGISITFLAIDISGGVFSLLSLIFKDKFDGIAAITYLGVIVSTGSCFTTFLSPSPSLPIFKLLTLIPLT